MIRLEVRGKQMPDKTYVGTVDHWNLLVAQFLTDLDWQLAAKMEPGYLLETLQEAFNEAQPGARIGSGSFIPVNIDHNNTLNHVFSVKVTINH